ncbi:MAG: bifunctional oligoribonuclease/PAP phosphatase NrnA [Muribaculaceae bacterium]
MDIIETDKIEALRALIDSNSKFVLTCHKSPDGDAVGATMGLSELLRRMGKQAVVVFPNMPMSNLMFLPGAERALVCDVDPRQQDEQHRQQIADAFADAEVVFCMDFNDINRVQGVKPYLEQSSAKRVLIDHHLQPTHFCDVEFSFPEMSSTCELTYHLLVALGLEDKLTKLSASYLYMGLMTDTGNFAYNSNLPSTFEMAANLLRLGVDKNRIYARAFNQQSENSMRLQAYALSRTMKVKRELGVALVTLPKDVLRRYFYTNGDTEGLVNQPLKLPDVFCSVFMREDEDCVKVSMRSVGEFSVRDLCERYFSGGGHKNAAAGEYHGTLEDALGMYYAMLIKEKDNLLNYKEIYNKER